MNANKSWILDDQGQPVEVADVLQWARWFETANRSIAKTYLGEVCISTVFIGIDHNFRDTGEPLLFETMVFGGPLDQECERYATREAAEKGHEEMVQRAKTAAESEAQG